MTLQKEQEREAQHEQAEIEPRELMNALEAESVRHGRNESVVG